MRTHIVATSSSSQRNTTVEEATSKRSAGRASKKKSTWIETPAGVKSPGGTRRSKRTGVGVGGNDFAHSINSPETCVLDEGGPAKRTRLSERTASECGPSTASELPRLRRSPRVHDTAEPVEVWRSPRRRGSGFMSSQIKEEPIDVEIDDVPPKPSGNREEMAAPILPQRSPLLVQSLIEDREASDIHRREGSTETMAMCEEGSDRSLCDGENETCTEPVDAVLVPVRSIHAKSTKQSSNAVSTSESNRMVISEKLQKIATFNSGKRISTRSEVKLDRRLSKLTTADESIVQRRKKKSEESQIATIYLPTQQGDPSKAYSPRKKGYRHGVTRTRDAPLESIPPLKPTPPEERMDIIIPEGDSVELSNEMIYNFAQCMP
uniref:Shugoshin_C domain-containing protein n=1 Tax=Ascaris lumbricoides TaxID=6252 RepID=A0A0M3IDP7_ASCLU